MKVCALNSMCESNNSVSFCSVQNVFRVIHAICERNVVVKLTCERVHLRNFARLKQKRKVIILKKSLFSVCVNCVSHSQETYMKRCPYEGSTAQCRCKLNEPVL